MQLFVESDIAIAARIALLLGHYISLYRRRIVGGALTRAGMAGVTIACRLHFTLIYIITLAASRRDKTYLNFTPAPQLENRRHASFSRPECYILWASQISFSDVDYFSQYFRRNYIIISLLLEYFVFVVTASCR